MFTRLRRVEQVVALVALICLYVEDETDLFFSGAE
jgi:hypothetical protein